MDAVAISICFGIRNTIRDYTSEVQRPEATAFSAAGLGRGLGWVLGTGVGYLPWVADLARAWLSSPHRATTSVLHRVLFGGILDTAVVRHGLGERNNQGELCNRPLLELSLLGSHFW